MFVRLTADDHRITVLVQDDGVGFDVAEGLTRLGCYGLGGMQERAERIGGILRVESAPAKGTQVQLDVDNITFRKGHQADSVQSVTPRNHQEREIIA